MNRLRILVLPTVFILIGIMISPQILAANYPLTQIKTESSSPDISFKKTYDLICFGLSLYKLDALNRCSKEDLMNYAGKINLSPGVVFDIDNIGQLAKGWTRYYPFSIDGRNFIMRIFLTIERHYQPVVPILYEGSIASPAITFQVLPSLNEIMSDCKIKPRVSYSSSEVSRSS